MATLKRRLRKNNGTGYDIVYFETLAELVKCADGSTVESTLANKSNLNHAHETRFYPYRLNTANFCEGFNYETHEMWFNYYGAQIPITLYSLGNGMGERLGYMIHSGNLAGFVADCTAGNSNAVGGYSADKLWRSDGAIWNASANVTCTGDNAEWSFDVTDTGNGGSYWHVWSGNTRNFMIQCWPKAGYTRVNHNGDLNTEQLSNTKASTTDPGAGSALSSGTVFFCLRIRRSPDNGSIEKAVA